jgi:hypothetical protein
MYPLTRSTSRARFFGAAPSLLLDFLSGSLDSRIAFTRASTATFFNSAGVLTSASNDVARFDYDPATLAPLGLLIEESRTNSIRNNTMQGAVAGTPGTLPTNWAAFTALTGLTQQVVGTGTESGITYIDIRLSGTPSGSGSFSIFPETSTGVAALIGQVWTLSTYVRVSGGTTTGVSGALSQLAENNAAGVFLTNSNTSFSLSSLALSGQRFTHTRTLNQATTAFVQPYITIALTGAAIDITLRIGLPQLEQGAFATSVIPTTTTALTRAADVASVNTLTPWFNVSAGTLYAEVVGLMTSALSGNRTIAAFSDNTYNNSIALMKGSGIAEWRNEIYASGSVQASFVFATYSQGAIAKLAIAYQANDVNSAVNGAVSTTDTTATIPTVTKLELRDPTGASGGQPTCYLRRIIYYPRRLANAELQSITL